MQAEGSAWETVRDHVTAAASLSLVAVLVARAAAGGSIPLPAAGEVLSGWTSGPGDGGV